MRQVDIISPMNNTDPSSGADETPKCRMFHVGFDTHGVPLCLKWTADDVAEWITFLGYPQYVDCFRSNFISGRKLINIDANSLPKIGVQDFEHIRVLAGKIREYLGIEDPFWNRSITLTERDALSHYLQRKSKTGSESFALTFEEHVRSLQEYQRHGISRRRRS